MKIGLFAMVFGVFLAAGTAYAGPLPGGTDADMDGVEDAFDNCTDVSNSSQADTDHNGCGNECQCGTGLLAGGNEFLLIGMNFGMAVSPGTGGDCDYNGLVGGTDVLKLGQRFGMAQGPSGITTAQCNPLTCACVPAP